MRSFKDAKGTAWDVEIDLEVRARIMCRTGVDLFLVAGANEHAIEMMHHPERQWQLLLAVTQEQRDKNSVTEKDFAKLLNNTDLVSDAMDQVIESTFDFFPNRSATVLRKTALTFSQIHREEQQKALTELEAEINDPAFKEKMRAAMKGQEKPGDQEKSEQAKRTLRRKPKPSATESPASSGSTPEGSPGEN